MLLPRHLPRNVLLHLPPHLPLSLTRLAVSQAQEPPKAPPFILDARGRLVLPLRQVHDPLYLLHLVDLSFLQFLFGRRPPSRNDGHGIAEAVPTWRALVVEMGERVELLFGQEVVVEDRLRKVGV